MGSIMSARLAAEVDHAMERNGWTAGLAKKASEGTVLAGFRDVLEGRAQIKPIEHLIDCDADPFVPEKGWFVDEHKRDGVIQWNPKKVKLYLSFRQYLGFEIWGEDLRVVLASQSVMNANVLDYLLREEKQHLIPKEWGHCIFFWGTIYRSLSSGRCVRYLYKHDGRWGSSGFPLCSRLDGYNPAAVFVS